MFFVGSEQLMLFGAISLHEQRAGELIPLFRAHHRIHPRNAGGQPAGGRLPDQPRPRPHHRGGLSGEDLDRLVAAAGMMFGVILQEIPGAQVRPVPSLELLFPEVRVGSGPRAAAAVGMSARDFGISVDVLMDGRDIGEFKQEGEKKIDLKLKASERTSPPGNPLPIRHGRARRPGGAGILPGGARAHDGYHPA